MIVAISTVTVINYGKEKMSGAPPFGIPENEIPVLGQLDWLNNWERPEGPASVTLQVGHWKNEEVPEELENLRKNSGASAAGYQEWEVNMEIVELTAQILEKKGIEVQILPTTVPPNHWADVFVSVHADGSIDGTKRGYKIASPWRDMTGNAERLVDILEENYEAKTNLTKDDNITRNMRGYYAFSWWRYEHSLHPMTTAAIAETGFLTNYSDRRVIVDRPEIVAEGLAGGIIEYLEGEGLLDS